jgi:hypothetical protein
MKQTFLSAMNSWHQGKLFVEHAVAVSNDALHMAMGVLVWLGLAVVAKRPVSSWLPWTGLLIVLLWNEAVDLYIEQWPDPGQQYGEGARDLVLTLFVPTLILIVARYRPQLLSGPRR